MPTLRRYTAGSIKQKALKLKISALMRAVSMDE